MTQQLIPYNLEVGRTAVAFAYGDPRRVRRLMAAYRARGGEVTNLGRDAFLQSAALQLGHIAELIMVANGDRAPVTLKLVIRPLSLALAWQKADVDTRGRPGLTRRGRRP